MPNSPLLALSIIIPIHNEEAILRSAVVELREDLRALGQSYEIVLAENGSRDRTLAIAQELSQEMPDVRWLSTPEPDYGQALKAGLLAAHGEIAVCDEIDLCDVSFHRAAIELIDHDGADLVVGSKLLRESADRRPMLRHLGSLVYTGLLRTLIGFRGTDTHGPKALRRARALPIVRACVVGKDVFASELVIRAERAGLRVREVPLDVREKRPPSINLIKRVPAVVRNLARLAVALRTSPSSRRG
jgi:glycosyltransferase involved in cell wall biosynthesis